MYYEGLQKGNTDYIYNLMAGNDNKALSQLEALFKNGKVLEAQRTSGNNLFNTLTKKVALLLYAKLIEFAYVKSEKHYRPFIVRIPGTEHNCLADHPISKGSNGKKTPLSDMISGKDAKLTSWCDPYGNSWLLVTGVHYHGSAHKLIKTDQKRPFQAMDGGDSVTLDGKDEHWGGIQLKDFIIPSVTGFIKNGYANGYKLDIKTVSGVGNENLTISGDGPENLIWQGGVRTPGFLSYTICLDAQEAYDTITSKAFRKNRNMPVCGRKPRGVENFKLG